MSLFGIGRRYYRPFRYSPIRNARAWVRRAFGKKMADLGFKRYYRGRFKGGF